MLTACVCESCQEKDEIIVELQHALREERHVSEGLKFSLQLYNPRVRVEADYSSVL